jgi:predicted nucleotidyltransferase component of viral defense system
MLHFETVEPGTFSLLNELFAVPELRDFSLVGGTALSLLLGHRISVDLDLFCHQPFDNDIVKDGLTLHFKNRLVIEDKSSKFAIFCYIDEIKVDLVKHPLPLIRSLQLIENVRMYSTEDIIAMKVQAILGRGKKKDFWDIAELLQHYSVQDFVTFHREKYSKQNLLISVPQALTYFADADESEDPVSLKGQTWKSVQSIISKKVSEYLN